MLPKPDDSAGRGAGRSPFASFSPLFFFWVRMPQRDHAAHPFQSYLLPKPGDCAGRTAVTRPSLLGRVDRLPAAKFWRSITAGLKW